MLELLLYTKEGCTLCDEVKEELVQLAREFPHHLKEVDITHHRHIFARYRYVIPVVKSGDRELRAPITREQLKTFMAAVTSESGRQ